ncbi:Poly-beta-1,6-N-acetyl-D-glucosamine synthase [Candidatus Bealeia paramacronuclearis]|uniref:Poly-beta-1,6-N-acetyl-D-glucosamine synthase n=1 Tax=Candidatus Bealeia paramacronuclearis TaxID=1921001 RepID=A0ABZ2C3H8_9PROT|nr:Poly-beta-1,6-N-acetyl-D-glucosamine synthase [Candidatus Bealeia paramacronuclearis]
MVNFFIDIFGPIYLGVVLYVAIYPVTTSIIWILTALIYRYHWEDKKLESSLEFYQPFVSVMIPAHNEAQILPHSLPAITSMDYPHYEVLLLDDGSTDNTLEIAREFVESGKLRILHKSKNQGKALALNDGFPCTNGEIIVIFDADAEPHPQFLNHMIKHFQHPRVGAVTGHPRVKNTNTFLARLQLVEFTSIIGLLRRSQRIWGRIVTISGIASAFRREALHDMGGFSPNAYTEDIEITWRLQKHFWDVRYEPKATVWMHVPETFTTFFRQRLRWTHGLMQVLKWNADVMTHLKWRRMWPVFIEAVLSTSWVVAFALVLIFELLTCKLEGDYSPYFLKWGIVVATVSLVQLFTGLMVDSRYDKDVLKFFPYAIYYPLIYWITMVAVTLWALPVLFKNSKESIRWKTGRK